MKLEDLLNEDVVDSYSVRVPTHLNVSKKQTKAVNLNIYRNLHHFHLDNQKKQFAQAVKPLIRDKPFAERVWIHYTIYAPRNGRLDTMNVGAIVDKYFCDVLVEAGRIPDDHYGHVVLSTFSFGSVCPMDGHAIATVNILKRRTPMRILLDQDDIQSALNAYVSEMNLPNATGEVEIIINNGDVEAEIIMESDETPTPEDKPKTTKRRGRPKGSKNKTTKEDADVEGPPEGSSDSSDSGGSQASEGNTESGDAGEETPAPAQTKKGNLFGDSDDEESSDSPTTSTEADAVPAETEDKKPVIAPKKTSIFDA